MKILIGCEESQVICAAFRNRGHEAYICDIKECSGGHPEWHIKDDVLRHLDDGWDMMIAHPECKYLCFSGERWMNGNTERVALRGGAFDFFVKLATCKIPKRVIENSHSVFLNRQWGRPTQTIHPYHFGDPFKKSTCLWLYNVPPLVPKWEEVQPIGRRHPEVWLTGPGSDRSAKRAKTYPGIAKAMAEQWG